MAEIKEAVNEVQEVMETTADIVGPTVFSSSKPTKIVAGVVGLGIVTYAIVGTVKLIKKHKANKEVVDEVNPEYTEDAEFTEVEEQ